MAKQVDRQSGAALADGDTEAWRVFLARQIPKLYGLFMNRWPNPALAEELVQKTVFDAVRGRQTFDPAKGDPAQWLAGIARNNIRLEIRKRAARPGVNGDIARYLDEIDRRPLPNEVLERKETARLVRQALGQLPENERNVLTYKYLDDLPARTIAERLGLTEKAVHSLLYRARISLRNTLQQSAAEHTGA